MFKNNDYSKVVAVNASLLTIIAILYLLFIWSSLVLPFVIALLVSFWIISVANFFQRYWVNSFLSYLASFISFFVFFFLVWWIINTNINELTKPENINFYQNRIETLINPILDYLTKFNINEETIRQKILKNIDFSGVFWNVTWAITSILSSAGLIIVYVLFILLEHRYFRNKLELMYSNPIKRSKVVSIITKIKNDIRAYFFIKTLTSISTWFFSYLILLLFRVDFALFWGFSFFILNFIPTVWSIIAVFVVSIFAIIQFGFNITVLFLISILIWIQFFIWSVIEPKLMWSKLNLSPLVILLSLWVWGMIWWVIWMLLSVPIMVIINIILSKFDSTRPISILLSEKWNIDVDENINIDKTKEKFLKILKSKFKL